MSEKPKYVEELEDSLKNGEFLSVGLFELLELYVGLGAGLSSLELSLLIGKYHFPLENNAYEMSM